MNFFQLSDNDGSVINLDQILDFHLTFDDHILMIRYGIDDTLKYYYKDEEDARIDYRRILNQ